MTKHQRYLQKMLDENQSLFASFEEIHNLYSLESQKWQQQFNQLGKKVQQIIQEYETRLCQHSEKGQYAKYSSNLAEKFRQQIKKRFPLIDFVGVEIITSSKPDPIDSLPRIRLD